ncbi:unnamed protein product [Urochloa decumbens]|uniref:WRKY domain-containing protein n=1 Tax=Urochloa decumbens TaxID=240449 RepID=A0ABC9B0T9_9POAL
MERVNTSGFAASEILARGRESAESLHAMLNKQQLPEVSTMPHELRDLVEQVLHCCDRALAALGGGNGGGACKKRKPERGDPADLPSTMRSKRLRVRGGDRGIRVQKKWTMEDGFAWRKYGQKNINGSKQPRLYFRCSYKDDSGCMARRQVQHEAVRPGRWSCDNDGLVVYRETPVFCNSPEEEEELQLQEGMIDVAGELIEQSTPVLDHLGMSSPWLWEPQGRCQEYEAGHGESMFDIGEFIDIDSLLQ